MQARDIMSAPVISVTGDTPIVEVAQLLVRHGISGVPVLAADGRLVGIVSEGDLMRRIEIGTDRQPSWWLRLLGGSEEQARDYVKTHGRTVSDVMSRKVATVSEEAGLAEIAALLERRHIKRVPVVRGKEVVGIVSRANLLQAIASTPAALTPDATDVKEQDRALKARVEEEMERAGLDTVFFNVIVADGVVALWGVVRSEAQLQAARAAAATVTGDPARVQMHMSVQPMPMV